ncbi:DUF2630 family protein [Streptomyces sp. NPDC047002]|uniref:DUF2630 family protein n=1 Tax=Streptomyces sp. NPDC047002 TaxID=3155475 RepID=UPI0034523610
MSAPSDDKGILHTINGLVDEEHALRERSSAAQGPAAEERERLRAVEIELDQCWDLLRQRRAKSEYGEDPASAKVRPPAEVENYQG